MSRVPLPQASQEAPFPEGGWGRRSRQEPCGARAWQPSPGGSAAARQRVPSRPAWRGKPGEVGHPGRPRPAHPPSLASRSPAQPPGLGRGRNGVAGAGAPGAGPPVPRLRRSATRCPCPAAPVLQRVGPPRPALGEAFSSRARVTIQPGKAGADGGAPLPGGPGRAHSHPARRAAVAAEAAGALPRPGPAAGRPQPRPALAGRLRARPGRSGPLAQPRRTDPAPPGRAPASYGKVSRQARKRVAEQGRLSHV